MVAEEIGPLKGLALLCCRAISRVATALLVLLKNALRPTTERSHRLTALLLLASVALLGLGVFVGTQLSTVLAALICLVGAMGLLVSGFAGTHLDATAHHARPTSGDFPMLHR